MTTVTETAAARAGLLGNPSDGYNGRALSVGLANFRARVSVEPADVLWIRAAGGESDRFADLARFLEHAASHGCGGAHRVVQAAIKRFAGYCRDHAIELPTEARFAVRYETEIPRQVGLAGSSAIITAALRALARFFAVSIPLPIRPTLALEAETVELGIDAGLQDRVIQAYGGLVYMDLGRGHLEARGHGEYERLDPALLPPLYLAYRRDLAKESGRVLRPLRERFDRGERDVIDTLAQIAELAAEGRDALLAGDAGRFAASMNRNFDLRRTILPISEANLELVETARASGASAKFAGSGGSIVGVYEGEAVLAELEAALGAVGAEVLRVTPAVEENDT